MAEMYYPFDTGPGANVTQDMWTLMARNFRKTGIAGDSSNSSLKVSSSSSTLTSVVAAGEASICGHQYVNDQSATVTHSANTSGKPRIDLVVLRLDRDADKISLAVITGTPSDNPSAPNPQGNRDGFTRATDPGRVFDIRLAEVRVEANAGVIAATKYNDVREAGTATLSTGTSVTRPDAPGLRPMGSLHYEGDNRRWVGWDGTKWGTVAEFGPWRSYTPKVYWEENSTAGTVRADTGWTTQGRYRRLVDGSVTVNIYMLMNYTLNDFNPDDPFTRTVTPSSFLRVTLPVNSGDFGQAMPLLPCEYQRGADTGDIRTGFAHVMANRDHIPRIFIQGTNSGANGRGAGNLDSLTDNSPLSRGTILRISGTYECAA